MVKLHNLSSTYHLGVKNMGGWVSCNMCSGVGITPCTCYGARDNCSVCNNTGEVPCHNCKGHGSVFLSNEVDDEMEFVYDEY